MPTAEKAESGASQSVSGAQTVSDIGVDEAMRAQIKRVVANELDMDNQIRQVIVQEMADLAAHRARLRIHAEQILANSMNQAQINSREAAENSRAGFNWMNPESGDVIKEIVLANLVKQQGG